jgi:serine/threonine protein kinase
MTPWAAKALAIAARRRGLLDATQVRGIERGPDGVDALRTWLPGCGLDPASIARLTALLPAPGTPPCGAWRPLAHLADGGMGTVWLAVRADGDRLVVIKRARPAPGDEGQRLNRRLGREAGFMRRLHHPAIVRCHDSGVDAEGAFFVVLEYIESGDLAGLVAERGALPARQALDILYQVADGLSEAHRLNLVHRDIKPSNIYVTARLQAKLADFGIARAAGSDSEVAMTMPGMAMGSPEWMAPEQVMGESAGVASDLYALGCVLHFALTGAPPYAGRPQEVMHQHVTGPLPDPRARMADLPEAVARLVLRCCAKDPAGRFPDVLALRAAIAEVREQVGGDDELVDEAGLLAAVPALAGWNDPTPSLGSTIPAAPGGDAGVVFRQAETGSQSVPQPDPHQPDTDRALDRRGATSTRRRSESGRQGAAKRLALAGSTAAVPLPDVLRTLREMRATGVLRLSAPQGWRDVVVCDGDPAHIDLVEPDQARSVVEALCEAGGVDPATWTTRLATHPQATVDQLASAVGDTATQVMTKAMTEDLLAVCQWTDVGFEFVDGAEGEDIAAQVAVGRSRGTRIATMGLLMEAARRADELDRLRGRLPPPTAVVAPVAALRDNLRAACARHPRSLAVELIDGTRSMAELAENPWLAADVVLAMVADGLAAGWLHVVDAASLVQAARAALAAGAADRAVHLLHHALAADGDHADARALLGEALAALPRAADAAAARPPSHVQDTLAGDPATAYAGEWLALLSRPDGEGLAVHLFARSAVMLGKMSKEPVQIAVRDYPVDQHIERLRRISRSHCEVRLRSDGHAEVIDQGTANGTSVDGTGLVAGAAMGIEAGREHRLDLADVVTLGVAVIAARPGPLVDGVPPGMLPPPIPDAVVLRRTANRPELAYALVTRRLTIGGPGADLPLPGLPSGPAIEVALRNGRWIVRSRSAGDGRGGPWSPAAIGARLAIGQTTLMLTVGDHAQYG